MTVTEAADYIVRLVAPDGLDWPTRDRLTETIERALDVIVPDLSGMCLCGDPLHNSERKETTT